MVIEIWVDWKRFKRDQGVSKWIARFQKWSEVWGDRKRFKRDQKGFKRDHKVSAMVIEVWEN